MNGLAGGNDRDEQTVAPDPSFAPDPEPMQSRERTLAYLVNRAEMAKRHPIDLNYVAIPVDLWEQIVGLVNRV